MHCFCFLLILFKCFRTLSCSKANQYNVPDDQVCAYSLTAFALKNTLLLRVVFALCIHRTVQGGGFLEFYPKPTTSVRISDIPRKFGDSIVEDMLKVALEDDEDESIVQVERRDDGSVYVQFAKVWEARGCEILLNGNEKLFGEKIAVELWYG